MKLIKRHKNGIITFLSIFLVLFILYIFLFNTVYIKPLDLGEYVDNSMRNSTISGSLVRADDELYFSAYNHFPKNGIYKISDFFTQMVCGDRFKFDFSLPFTTYSYKGNLLEDFVTDNSEFGNAKIKKLNFANGEYEDFINLECPDNEKITDYFTLEGELYFVTDKHHSIYQYEESGYKLIASEEYCGKGFAPEQYYQHYMYFSYLNHSAEKSEELTELYQYDMTTQKVIQRIDLNQLPIICQKEQMTLEEYQITDHFIFFVFKNIGNDNYVFYKMNISDGDFLKVYETNEPYQLNSYGEYAYLSFRSGGEKKGLYAFTLNEDIPKKLVDSEICEIYIVDKKYVYYEDDNNCLYRITPDGKEYGRVF